jgi:hypothetical protein
MRPPAVTQLSQSRVGFARKEGTVEKTAFLKGMCLLEQALSGVSQDLLVNLFRA